MSRNKIGRGGFYTCGWLLIAYSVIVAIAALVFGLLLAGTIELQNLPTRLSRSKNT